MIAFARGQKVWMVLEHPMEDRLVYHGREVVQASTRQVITAGTFGGRIVHRADRTSPSGWSPPLYALPEQALDAYVEGLLDEINQAERTIAEARHKAELAKELRRR